MSEEKARFIATIGLIVTIIVTGITATWMISREIGEIRVEIHKENSETRDVIRKEIHKEIGEIHKEIGEIREEIGRVHMNIGDLRGDVANISTKLDEFKESHRREHDLFYDSTAKKDEENSTSAN